MIMSDGARRDPAVKTDPSAELEEEAQVQNTTNTTMCQPRWLRPDLASIPDELKALPQWVLWGKNGEDVEKKPFQPSGLPASSKDPATWSQYDQVILPYYRGGYAGIGFVIAQNDPYIGIDLDKCLNPETGALEQWALDYLTTLGSYTEISPSGTGTHTIIKGSLPDGHACRKKGIEVYSTERYLTVTGHRLPEYPASIEERIEQIAEVHKRVFGDTATRLPGAPAEWTTGPCREWLGPDNDDDLIEMALKSRSTLSKVGLSNSATFKQLYEADEDALSRHYPDVAGGQDRAYDWSQCDAALCAHLAYYTGRNCDRMRDLWGKSELGQRDKFTGRPDYVESTILSACSICKNVYRDRRLAVNDGCVNPEDAGLELNEKHAGVWISGQFKVLTFLKDPMTGRTKVEPSTVTDIKNKYCNKKVLATVWDALTNSGVKLMSLGDAWRNHPNRRDYEGVVFDPSEKASKEYYNYWQGFAVEPKQGDWSMMQSHILNVISSGDAELARWITAWMARIVQDPGGKRPGTSIVLRGGQGTGKGTFVHAFGAIFGEEHYIQVADLGAVVGQFNGHFKDKVLVYVDEVPWSRNRAAEGILKNMVTEPRLNIEEKFFGKYQVQNNVNFIFASNSEWVSPAGIDERRFCVLDADNPHAQETKKDGYFDKIDEQMRDGGIEAMMYDLLHMDISDVNLRDIPKTEALWEQKMFNMSPVESFWYECLSKGALRDPLPSETGDMITWGEVAVADFYRAYKNHVEDTGRGRRVLSVDLFGKQIRKLCPGISVSKNRVGGGRQRFYHFPTLQECRAAFDHRCGACHAWD